MRQRRSPAETVGAEAPGEFDSRTIRQPINNVSGHGIRPGIQSAKRVGSAWRNAVGHTCPMRSRAFLLGVNGGTRVFGTFGPGSNPGGGAWRQHVESVFPLHSIRCLLYRIQGVQASPQAAKRRHALVAQWIERPPPERKVTSPILVEGTHENSANHNAWSPSSLLSHAVAPRTGSCITRQRPCSSTDRAPVS